MIVKFNNDYLELLYQGKELPGKPQYGVEVVRKYKKTILMLTHAENVGQILRLRGLNFELLKGDYKGLYSVRVDLKYRLILSIEADDILLAKELIVEDLTNHYK